MKIAIVTPSLNPHAGGVERFAHNVADALQPIGTVLMVDLSEYAVPSAWIRRLGLSGAASSWRARRALRAANPDLVISNGSAGWCWGRWRRIHVYHGTMIRHSWADKEGRRLRDWFIAGLIGGGVSEMLSGWGAHRVAVSRSAAREVERYYRISVHAVVWNSCLTASGDGSTGRTRDGLLFVGRRESRKGYEEAVAGATAVGARLKVAGPGADRRTQDLGILDDAGLLHEYARSTALIFPSRYEACSYVVLEALAAGCPVITTRVGWVDELVERLPSYEQLLVRAGDVKSIGGLVAALQAGNSDLLMATSAARDLVRAECSSEAFSHRWTEVALGVMV